MIVLVRHGETEWNVQGKRQGQQDSPLTAKGVVQASKLTELLYLNPVSIFASPLGRVVETVKFMGVYEKVIFDVRLKEISFGDSEGKVDKKAHNLWKLPFHGGESYADVYERAGKFLLDLPDEECIMIVAHETINKMLAGQLLQLPVEKILKLKQPNGLTWII